MKKYKVTFDLMKDPTKGDDTFKQAYEVDAENEMQAYSKAQDKQENDTEDVRYRSVFSYDVIEI